MQVDEKQWGSRVLRILNHEDGFLRKLEVIEFTDNSVVNDSLITTAEGLQPDNDEVFMEMFELFESHGDAVGF